MVSVDALVTGFKNSLAPKTAPPSVATILRSVLWPVAIMAVIHRSYVLGTNGYITDDFGPVYRAVIAFKLHQPVYGENFNYVDPHYIYPPGGTLLLAPFGYLPVDASRYWFITINTIAIVIAAYFLLRLFNFTLASVVAPALLLAMFCTESVTNTLVFTNINGVVLLLEVLFFRWLLHGTEKSEWLAGVAIGLTLVIKPLLAPLLLLPLLNRQWRVFAAAFGIPAFFNLVALYGPRKVRIVDGWDYLRRTVKYLGETRDYFNSSIAGNGLYYGLPEPLIAFLRIAFLAIALVSVWLLYKYYRRRDPRFWALTTGGVLLTASFLLLGLGQGYYSMALFPFVMTIVLPNSVLRNWPAWLAVYGFFSMDRWLLGHWPTTGRALEYLKITYGWCLLLIVVMMVLVLRYRDARAAGTLDQGLDPEWMRAQTGTKESATDDDIERPEGESDRRAVAGATDS
ncbi:glycosyltransferase family 87 protein [Mycobacteroides abscessus]|uniref:glycosyltransferase family 87 protein n=1 Tax=Mycobacteroides abscessus TaxID=36809 RepID=UPI000C257A63|nr:glycosyltransferase family 87 protein [Mycobacteroides abscessus]